MKRRPAKSRLLAAAAVSIALALSLGLPGTSAAGHGSPKALSSIIRQSSPLETANPGNASRMHPPVHRSSGGLYYSLTSSAATFTVGGQKIQLSLAASKSSTTGPVSSDVTLFKHFTASSTGFSGEKHDFSFANLKTGDLSITGSGGTASKAKLSFGSAQVGPFGSVTLTFTPLGTYKNATCANAGQGYYDHYYLGTMSGSIDFKTVNSNETSTFGELKGTVTLKNSKLDLDNGCQPPSPTPGRNICSKGVQWNSPSSATKSGGYTGTEQALGNKITTNGSSSNLISVSRQVTLTGLGTGVVGSRLDTLDSSTASQNFSTASASPHKLTVHATASSSDTFLKGSATETAGSSNSVSAGKCYLTGTGTTQDRQYFTGGGAPFVYTPGSTKLAGKSSIGGNITLPAATDSDGANGALIGGESYS